MLDRTNAVLIIIDVQGKLAQLMYQKESFFANLQRLIQGAQHLAMPILWTEQAPAKLGSTTPELQSLLEQTTQPIGKLSFSCCGEAAFMSQLEATQRKQVLIAGLETHICVYQTALDLLEQDYEVAIIADAVSSRTEANKQIALTRIRDEGANLASTEMVLFELLRIAEGTAFKAISQLVKG